MECISNFLRSCIALFVICMVRAIAVCAFRCCVTVFCVMVIVADTAGPACLRRGASHGRVEEPAVLALDESFWLC